MQVFGYCRVSTTEQADDGVSLAAQKQQITGYAMMKGWKLADVFVEAALFDPIRTAATGSTYVAVSWPVLFLIVNSHGCTSTTAIQLRSDQKEHTPLRLALPQPQDSTTVVSVFRAHLPRSPCHFSDRVAPMGKPRVFLIRD